MAERSSVCEHLHLPIQSGDDAMLHRMGRQYTVAHYLERIGRLRSAIPGISRSTDVIVGFCGETREQHEATLRLLREVRFDQVFAAAFSPRPGTPAALLPDDVPAVEKRRRLNDLLAVQEDIGLERNRAWVGRVVEVLVDQASDRAEHEHDEVPTAPEGADAAAGGARPTAVARDDGSPFEGSREPLGRGQARLAGRTRQGKLVHLVGDPALVGCLVHARVVHAGPYSLRGRLT
jgi:tRNA A37 methylthiotransferase MiaB